MVCSQDVFAMTKRLSLAFFFMSLVTVAASAACLQYGREHAFDGILTLDRIQSFEGGDYASYPVLALDAPLCMQEDPLAPENGGLSAIEKIQVIAPIQHTGSHQRLIGQKVTVRGVPLAAISRRHVLPLVVDARSIEPISAAAAAFPAFWPAFYNTARGAQCERLVELTTLPLATYGSLDTDPVVVLDATDLMVSCPHILQQEDAAIQNTGAIPPADWRAAAQFDDQARLGHFEFSFANGDWRWTGYYRQQN